ncbi:hypothetical protein AWS24_18025 [Enterobacter asburiae]|nr:hypothetical protein AWS24_18025 [Enterobacter asburiae]
MIDVLKTITKTRRQVKKQKGIDKTDKLYVILKNTSEILYENVLPQYIRFQHIQSNENEWYYDHSDNRNARNNKHK